MEKAGNRAVRKISGKPADSGDVGAGKTIVGFLAMLLAVDNGYQAVLMAPTEVLAEQHYEDMMGFLKNYNLPYACVLVTGTTKQKKRFIEELRMAQLI